MNQILRYIMQHAYTKTLKVKKYEKSILICRLVLAVLFPLSRDGRVLQGIGFLL
jgi:hypothetical protein